MDARHEDAPRGDQDNRERHLRDDGGFAEAAALSGDAVRRARDRRGVDTTRAGRGNDREHDEREHREGTRERQHAPVRCDRNREIR